MALLKNKKIGGAGFPICMNIEAFAATAGKLEFVLEVVKY